MYMEKMPKDLTNKLWANDSKYNLDRLITYRNAYNCWVDNKGKVKDTEISKTSTMVRCPNSFSV